MDLHTRMSIKALRNFFLELLCQNGRRVLVKGLVESKDNVGLVRKALLCIRSKRCSRAVCVLSISPYVTLRAKETRNGLRPFDQNPLLPASQLLMP